MGKADLESANLKVTVKNAYRRQAKIHHPDLGGQASTFRKILRTSGFTMATIKSGFSLYP